MGSISKVSSLKSAGGSVLDVDSLKAKGVTADQISDVLKYDNKSIVFFTNDIIKRIESRSGLHQIEYMNTLGMRNVDYNLIQVE